MLKTNEMKNYVETEGRSRIAYPDYSYVDTAIVSVNRRNNVMHLAQVIIPSDTPDCFGSMFRFKEEYFINCRDTRSVTGSNLFTCYADFLWFDIDNKANLGAALAETRQLIINIERIDSALINSLQISFSGNKGFHIGIPVALFDMEPSVNLPKIHKRLAMKIAGDVPIDTTIYERNRLWRIPNSIHSMSGLYKFPLTYEQLSTLDIEQIKELAKNPLDKPSVPLTYEGRFQLRPKLVEMYHSVVINEDQGLIVPTNRLATNEPGWISEALNELSNGNRNTTFAKITGSLLQIGWLPQDIIYLLEPHAQKCGFDLEELRREVSGIHDRYGSATPYPSPPLNRGKSGNESEEMIVQSISTLLAQSDEPIEWCVEGLFPAEGAGILAGQPGIGKSWMLLDLAIEIARGGLWLGHFPTTKGPVLYIDEESIDSMLRFRIRKLLKSKKLKADDLLIHTAIGQELCFNEGKSVDKLHRVLDSCKPTLVIIDSLIRVHRGEENSATEMSSVFAKVKGIIRQYGCTVVIADHQRKQGQQKADGDILLRGSSEKVAFVDSLLSMHRKGELIVVEHSKSRFAEAKRSFGIKIEETELDATAVTYLGLEAGIQKDEKLEKALEFVDEQLPLDDWISRKDLVASAKKQKIGEKAVDDALRQLVVENQLIREDRLPEKGRGRKAAFFRRVSDEVNSE